VPRTRRPRAHHRVNPYLGTRRQNETEMFSDHDETSPSIAAVSAPSVVSRCSNRKGHTPTRSDVCKRSFFHVPFVPGIAHSFITSLPAISLFIFPMLIITGNNHRHPLSGCQVLPTAGDTLLRDCRTELLFTFCHVIFSHPVCYIVSFSQPTQPFILPGSTIIIIIIITMTMFMVRLRITF